MLFKIAAYTRWFKADGTSGHRVVPCAKLNRKCRIKFSSCGLSFPRKSVENQIEIVLMGLSFKENQFQDGTYF